MEQIRKARLASPRDGSEWIEYVVQGDPPKGTMKYTYFSTDRKHVIQFFNDPQKAASDISMQSRVNAIIGRYNPTLPESCGGAIGGNERTAAYFSEMYCWPENTVTEPEYGIVCPAFPSRFLLTDDACVAGTLAQNGISKRDKITTYFTNPQWRARIKPQYLGDFRGMLSAAAMLAKAVWRMHIAGLAHTDLSCNNVLLDPVSGTCIIIDIDTLAVPGVFSPMVVGSGRYLAPEVVESISLPADRRVPASTSTDDFALSVLLYEMLLRRHPLMGRRAQLVSRDNGKNKLILNPLIFGSGALFIEHPVETVNRPDGLNVTIGDMGSDLEKMFLRAFVDGLHDPSRRPGADEWERVLDRSFDLLQPCSNPNCPEKWFIMHDTEKPVCPFCGTRVADGSFIRLHLCTQLSMLPGQWFENRVLNGYDSLELHQWHIRSDYSNDSDSDKRPFARLLRRHQGWVLDNLSDTVMITDRGELCMPGENIPVCSGMSLRAGLDGDAFLIDFRND